MEEDIRNAFRQHWEQYERSRQNPVRIGLLGQPGAGKSSLINSIVGHEVAPVGVTTDYTTGPAEHHWNEIKLVDLPGYGTEGFPRQGFLEKFDVLGFDALLCVANGKFRAEDAEFFRQVRGKGKHCIFVRTYAGSLHQRGKTKVQLKEDVRGDLRRLLGGEDFALVFVDNATGEGIQELQDAIVGMLAPARKDMFYRWARGTSDEFLRCKRESCDGLVRWYAAGAAANGLNPVPGTDIAVDFAIVSKMFADILRAFGFTKEILQEYLNRYEFLRPLIGPVLNALLRGAASLLAKFAGQAAAKWVPFIGPVLAASAGAATVYAAGHDLADRCFELAKRIRDAELKNSAAA